MNKGETGEIAAVALTGTTKVKEVSHLVTQAKIHRPNFNPKAIYSDTAPKNLSYWQRLFGPDLILVLGLFHLMQRITDTLNAKCQLYWEALVALKNCFYTYKSDDYAALLKCLKDGTINSDGEKLSEREIKQLGPRGALHRNSNH